MKLSKVLLCAPERGLSPLYICACWLFALLAMPLLAGFAQTPATPSRVSGIVRDPTGALIPGATVQLARAGGAVVGSAITDGGGHFQFAQPASGDYHLVVVRPGFSALDQALHVTQSPMAPMALTLNLADVTTSVNVDAGQDIDVAAPENNNDAATVSADDMKTLPIFDGDIVATLSAFLDTGVAGEGGTTLIVDGVETTNLSIAESAIDRVSINEDPYTAEYRQPGRGQVEIVTKSAADHFHGSASFTYRNSALNGTNYFATTKPSEQRNLYEGYLTGPIKPLRNTAFLFSMSRKERDVYTQVLATTLPTVMPTQNVYTPTRTTEMSMKVNRQYNDHHSGYVLYKFHDEGDVNDGVGGLVQESAGYSSNDFDQDLTYHDDLSVSANILNQLDVHYERDDQSVINNSDAQQTIVEGVGTFGSAQLNAVYTENNPTVNDMVTWSTGKNIPQTMKFGIQLPNLGRRIWEDRTNRDGTYTYASAAAYASGTASSFSIQQGQERFETLFAQPSAFFLDQMQLGKRLTVTPGLRYDFQNTLSNTKDGLEPRLSIAYMVDKKHALVVRTGSGIYIRRVGVNIGQQLARYQFAAERNLLITDGLCLVATTCTPTLLAAEPPSLFQYQPGLQAPEQAYFGLSVERQVTKKSTLTVGYNGYRGWHALRSVDVNAPLAPFTSYTRPDANFAQVLQLQSQGYQKTDGMSVSYRGRVGNVVSGFLQYTLQHSDANTTFSTFMPQNQYKPNDEWSRSDFDQRQRLGLFATLYPDKPFTFGVGFYDNTPLPYTITTGTDDYKTGVFNAGPAGVPRNSLNGGDFQDLQVRLGYTYKLHPKVKDNVSALAFSVSSFNTLNRVNFATYNGVLGSPSFEQPTSANDPRRLQLQVSYSF
jgi:hypothetical protein